MTVADLAIIAGLVFAWGTRYSAGPAVTVIAFTILLSVVAHGLTADPLARRYGPRLAITAGGPDDAGLHSLPARRLIRRAS